MSFPLLHNHIKISECVWFVLSTRGISFVTVYGWLIKEASKMMHNAHTHTYIHAYVHTQICRYVQLKTIITKSVYATPRL